MPFVERPELVSDIIMRLIWVEAYLFRFNCMGELRGECNVCDGYVIQYKVESFCSRGQVFANKSRYL
jgi:hypothetical protein